MSGYQESHAIVLGGSIAGLLAARVLSDRFDTVTVIERDAIATCSVHRRGVPHGQHAHALLAGGLKVVEEMFPGFTDEIVSDGSVPGDPALDGLWFLEGGFLRKTECGCPSILLSRPFLESRIREKVMQTSGINVVDCMAVRGIEIDAGTVTGVVIEDGVLTADLVVDATGRGSQTSKWLAKHGYECPAEEKVEVQVSYTTRHFKRKMTDLDGNCFIAVPLDPIIGRGGVALAQEGDRWIVTLFGYFGQSAPEDLDGFQEFARSLPTNVMYNLVTDAEPIGAAHSFKFPASKRRRFEKMKRFPDGYLVFGDAICSFNPIYGQGMSSAALQAKALKTELEKGRRDLAKRFFRSAAKVIDGPWSIAVGGDLKMPQTEGRRTPAVKFINWYISKLHRVAHSDEKATRAFIRVAQMLDPAQAILRPSLAVRVLGKTLSTKLRQKFNLKIAQIFANQGGRGKREQEQRSRAY